MNNFQSHRLSFITAEAATITAAGISAAASGAGTAIGSSGRRKSQKRAYQYQRDLLDYQNQIALSNWELENEYNSPSAQMARYQEAGLNPNLIYGQSNTSGSIGEYQPTSVNPIESVGETIGSTLENTTQSFMDKLSQTIAIQRSGYQRDIEALDATIATATFNDKLAELQSDFKAKIAQHDADRVNAQSEQINAEARYDVVNDNNNYNELQKMYRDKLRSLVIDYATSVQYGEQNAKSEASLKKSSAIISAINAKFDEDWSKLDFMNMDPGKALGLFLNFIAKSIALMKK